MRKRMVQTSRRGRRGESGLGAALAMRCKLGQDYAPYPANRKSVLGWGAWERSKIWACAKSLRPRTVGIAYRADKSDSDEQENGGKQRENDHDRWASRYAKLRAG